jgi:hypothetical protein
VNRARETLGFLAGFTVWSLAFVVLYSVHGGGCAAGARDEVLRPALVGILAIHAMGLAILAFWLFRRMSLGTGESSFVRRLSFALAIAAGGSTLWIGVPVLFLTLCV